YGYACKFCFVEENNIPKNTDTNLELNALACSDLASLNLSRGKPNYLDFVVSKRFPQNLTSRILCFSSFPFLCDN
ncbi:MAG: hypothetical protein ACI85I_001144, partial [Arenicella sp.]